jgi:Flp pilus assembly pilin Flp
MGQGIRDGLRTVGLFLPKLGAFILIILATWIVANIVASLVTKVLRRVGVDNLAAKNEYGRQVVQRSKGGIAGIFGTVAKVAIWLVGLSLAFRAFGPNPVTDYMAATVAFIPRILAAVAIVVLAVWLASIVRNVLRSVLGGVSYGDSVATFVGAFIAVFGVLAALSQLNIAPAIINAIAYAALLAIVGVVIVGVGGGLIRPMSERWQRTLDKVEEDAPTVRANAQAKAAQAKAAAEKAKAEAYQPYPSEPAPATVQTPARQPAGNVSDETAIYDQPSTGYPGGPSGGGGARGVDPGTAGAPRPAGYNPEGYQAGQGYQRPGRDGYEGDGYDSHGYRSPYQGPSYQGQQGYQAQPGYQGQQGYDGPQGYEPPVTYQGENAYPDSPGYGETPYTDVEGYDPSQGYRGPTPPPEAPKRRWGR